MRTSETMFFPGKKNRGEGAQSRGASEEETGLSPVLTGNVKNQEGVAFRREG